MASGRTPQSEDPKQSASSTAKGLRRPSCVHDAVQHVDFSKAALPFTQVSCIKNLISKGESVCKLLVGEAVLGTGFVLFDEYIMTNAHLFKETSLWNNQLMIVATAQFAYESPLKPAVCMRADCITDIDRDMDYAVLKLATSGQTVPPGLLKHFGPRPSDGAACVIGHPAGAVKKMDVIYIIGKDGQSADEHESDKSLMPFINNDNILKADHVITYDTYMFGGASGAPMFDSEGRLVGMHSAGLRPEGRARGVIEYARPALEVFRRFVENLKNHNQTDLLSKIREISKYNSSLRMILEGTQTAQRY